MLPVYVPDYYPSFRCIASACRHTCCVGWEIDVDEAALARYDAYIRAHSPLSHRLQTAIDREADPPCFILDEEERCPFLNSCGLCDLITTHGEESLCRICTDHPRFRRVMADRVELGLGLCCEAAADLILSRREPMTLIPLPASKAASEPAAHADPEELDSVTTTLLEARGAVLKILQDRTRPLSDRIRHVLTALRIRFPMSTCAAWAEFLRDMERLDPAWDDCLAALAACGETEIEELAAPSIAADPIAAEQLTVYFLYRYLANEDERVAFGLSASVLIRARVAFAVAASTLIHAVADAASLPLAEAARLFSAEIEYSEENVERFMELGET
jgi:lysine-N-methylase